MTTEKVQPGDRVKITQPPDWRGQFIWDSDDPEPNHAIFVGKEGEVLDADTFNEDSIGPEVTAALVRLDAWEDLGWDDWWILDPDLEIIAKGPGFTKRHL